MLDFIYNTANRFLLPLASGGESGGSGEVHIPDIFSPFSHSIQYWKPVFLGVFISLLLSFIAIKAYKKREMIPGAFQNLVEFMVESMYDFIYKILGEHTKEHLPFLGTLFFYILVANLTGILTGFFAITAWVEITASMAALVFLYVQYLAIKNLGVKKYFFHLLGDPKDATGWAVSVILFPIHLFGEIVKPASLALRLFGNMTGEHILITAFVSIGVSIGLAVNSPVGLPIQLPFIFLGILVSIIQALVFMLLSTIYISMVLPHEEDH